MGSAVRGHVGSHAGAGLTREHLAYLLELARLLPYGDAVRERAERELVRYLDDDRLVS